MSRSIGRRSERPLDDLAVEVYHNHILRFHIIITDTRRLDDHQAAFAVNGGHVAPGEDHKAVLDQVKVCTSDFILKFFQHIAEQLPENDIQKSYQNADNKGSDSVGSGSMEEAEVHRKSLRIGSGNVGIAV